ncbi:MAG: rhomboid family intramembrane serine protease [Candidatus Rokubacteria bacterium]|nr:rhomboid family intramembrane serine protease [Candidatus Rokubacteria bacterium]
MIPLKDDVPTQSYPVVTVALIAANVLVYVYEFGLGIPGEPSRAAAAAAERAYEAFVYEFGLVPCRLGDVCPPRLSTALAAAPAPWLTVFTSMFVHGGLFHVGGNMLYLWIFGDNVEDSMGKLRFLVFYLLCGVAAALTQYVTDPRSTIPMVGASGAVSGALGAYLIMFPSARVWTLVVFGFFWRLVPVPALVVLGFWIVVQVLNGLFTFGSGQQGGVAFLAHVGGFMAGMGLVFLFRRRPRIAYRRY